jgi:spermidine synthase
MTIHLLTLGFVSLFAQVVILRELNVASFGIELIYLLALGFWLIGTGTGSMLARRTVISTSARLCFLLFLMAVVLPLEMIFVRGMRPLFGGVTGAYLPFPMQLAGVGIAVLPMAILLGLFFPWAAELYLQKKHTLAAAYAVESAGAVAAGIASTLVLRFGLQNLAVSLACAWLTALMVTALTWRERHHGLPDRRALLSGSVVLVMLLTVAIAQSSSLDRWMTSWNHPDFFDSWDTPYGRVTVTRHDAQISVYENDALSFETEGTSAEEFVHPAMLEHAAPRTVLLLGGGLEGVVREVLKYSPEHVDWIELNGRLLTGIRPLLPDSSVFGAKNLSTRVADPRRELEQLGHYDVILVGMPDPTSASANRYYTREFFTLARGHLNPHGVLAFRLRSAENYWTEPLALRNVSVVGALKEVFVSVAVLPGVTNLVLAGTDSLSDDPDIMSARLAKRQISTRLVTPAYLRYLFTNDRFSEIAARLGAESAPHNIDARPVCFSYATTIWLSKFMPGLFTARFTSWRVMAKHQPILLLTISGLILALSLLVRRRTSIRATLLAGTAGLCGMLVETVLILYYQAKTGILYQNIGLLLTLFMLGLMLGALVWDQALRHRGASRLGGVLTVTAFALILLVAMWMMNANGEASLLTTGSLLVLSGAAVAALFSNASALPGQGRAGTASRLYAADLIGGGIGTLVASLIWIPFVGLTATILLALVALVAAIVSA